MALILRDTSYPQHPPIHSGDSQQGVNCIPYTHSQIIWLCLKILLGVTVGAGALLSSSG